MMKIVKPGIIIANIILLMIVATAKAARSVGIPIHPVFKLPAESVMNVLDK